VWGVLRGMLVCIVVKYGVREHCMLCILISGDMYIYMITQSSLTDKAYIA
jgi:hypothetical protein